MSTSEAFTLKASFTVDVTLLGKKKQVAQGLVKGFGVFLTCVRAEIILHILQELPGEKSQ